MAADEPEVLKLYEFRYFDPLRKRWVHARYRAELAVIQENYEKFETIGEPELRRRGDPKDLGYST